MSYDGSSDCHAAYSADQDGEMTESARVSPGGIIGIVAGCLFLCTLLLFYRRSKTEYIPELRPSTVDVIGDYIEMKDGECNMNRCGMREKERNDEQEITVDVPVINTDITE